MANRLHINNVVLLAVLRLPEKKVGLGLFTDKGQGRQNMGHDTHDHLEMCIE